MLETGDYVRFDRIRDPNIFTPRIGKIQHKDEEGDVYIIWQNVNEGGNYWLTREFVQVAIFDIVFLKLYMAFNKYAPSR